MMINYDKLLDFRGIYLWPKRQPPVAVWASASSSAGPSLWVPASPWHSWQVAHCRFGKSRRKPWVKKPSLSLSLSVSLSLSLSVCLVMFVCVCVCVLSFRFWCEVFLRSNFYIHVSSADLLSLTPHLPHMRSYVERKTTFIHV